MKRSFWIVLCVLAVAGAWLLWPSGNRPSPVVKRTAAAAPAARAGTIALTAQPVNALPKCLAAATTNTISAKTNPFAFRLANTAKTIGQLASDRHAILLDNALIETDAKINLKIPAHLRAAGDPGAFIVQARGVIGAEFRAALAAAGGQVVSYIPNNAYLVQLDAAGVGALSGNPLVQAVLPYDPYYKVQSSLLGLAVNQEPLPDNTYLTLGLFSGNVAATEAQIQSLGGVIVGTDRSPFGPVLHVQPPENWIALAQLPGVQIVEPAHRRVSANDLSRQTLGVALTSVAQTNYLNLTGTNVLVEVNDTGIDASHPDLTNRVSFDSPGSGYDTDGHGTFVAGQIAGSGLESTTVTNAQGSIMRGTNGQFRGMAPLATLFSVGGVGGNEADEGILGRVGVGGNDTNFFVIGQTNFFIPGATIYELGQTNATNNFFVQYPDWYLQEAPAATNALISNNSWVNEGDNQYDLAAASYDAAVRDALPEVTGPQPVLFVFAAGNGGNGDNDGGGGTPDTIASPATAKNVITVGALEQQRGITNKYTPFGTTNPAEPWYAGTDSSSQVAGFSARGNVGIGTEGTYGRFKPDVAAPGTFVVSTRSAVWDTNTYYNPTNYYNRTIAGEKVGTNSLNYFRLSYFNLTARSNVISITIQVLNTDPVVPNMPIYFSATNYPNSGNNEYATSNNILAVPTGFFPQIFSHSGNFYFSVGNPTNVPVTYDVKVTLVTTNDLGDYYAKLQDMNDHLGTMPEYYRYESGTSMAAADVSGVLALMQDYFTNTLHAMPSPALLKAMLINGARPTGYYNLQVNNTINYEGWGLVNLPNSVRPTLTNTVVASSPVFFVDQSPTNALATGDTRTYTVSLSPAAQAQPLRITLAWTDPPGNPAAALKLVNSLGLIVTNTDNPTNSVVYFGNDIETNQNYNTPQISTNPAVGVDSINNVQNVFLPPNSGTNFTIVVTGAAVNVNAVTTQTNDASGNYAPNITQDFALVVSSGNGSNTNGFSVTTQGASSNPTGDQRITVVVSTNAPLMDQTVGASAPVMSTNTILFPIGSPYPYATNALLTIGQTNQWHFYVVTNTGPSADYTNAVFAVFLPDTLAIPRQGVFAGSDANSTRPEADIDLFVASDSAAASHPAWGLTNLDPVVISNCISHSQVGASSPAGVSGVFYGSALSRGGSEFIVDSNSTPGQVYYIGVQSEDQMAAEYGFLPEFSSTPPSQLNGNGDETVTFPQVDIPDGDANQPGYINTYGFAMYPIELQRVVATNVIAAQNPGDISIALSHSTAAAGSGVVNLMSHNTFANAPGVFTSIYDDSGRNIPGSQPSAGPGSLNQYVQQQGESQWTLHAADNAPAFVGSISGSLFLEKHQPLGNGINVIVEPQSWYYTYITVPVGYTNLTVYGIDLTTPTPTVYDTLAVKLGADPTLTDNDGSNQLTISVISPWGPGLSNSVSIGPPLMPGTYYVGVYNPDLIAHNVELGASLGLYDSSAVTILDYDSTGAVPLLDDAVNYAYLDVTNTDVIQGISIGLRVDHPRISDLVFHLISPEGTRYLLMENRGGQDTNGCGADLVTTNVFNASANGTAQPNTNVINTGNTSGTIPITYNFYTAPDEMTIYYGTTISSNSLIYDTGVIHNQPYPGGPGANGQDTIPVTINVPYGSTNGLPASTYLTIIMDQYPTNFVGGTNRSDAWTYSAGTVATNFIYLSFTEDTNLTTTPIKFAPTPFVPQTNFTLVFTDSFEAYTPTNTYYQGYSFGGWIVATNNVDVADSLNAYDGVNYLQLDDGVVYTNVTTVPGRKYNLTYEQGSNLSTNAGWQPENYVFTATDTNTELVLAASADALAGLVFTNTPQELVFTTNALLDDLVLYMLPANLYYQAEQDISGLTGNSAYGTMANGDPWQLEILDNRAGATNPAPELLGWQLEFTFANTNLSTATNGITELEGGIAQSNTVASNSIAWYSYTVPTNASFATNLLLFANLPVNVWFSTNVPPSIVNVGDTNLIANSTNNTATPAILKTNTASWPYIIPGQTYYLGVQNTNASAVTYGIEVDFDAGNSTNSSAPLFVISSVKVSGSAVQLSWPVTGGAQYQVQWTTNLTAAWNTVTNPATATTNGVATFTDNGAQTAPLGPMRFYRLVRVH